MSRNILYLVGDILNLWKLGRGWHWPEVNTRIVQLIMAKAEKGTKIIYIPGNHYHQLREFANKAVNGIKIVKNAIHTTADGRTFFITHGDEFDVISQNSCWIAKIGSIIYQVLLRTNYYFNKILKKCGCPYCSLSAYLKFKVKKAVNFLSCFEKRVMEVTIQNDVDGVICGHIHTAGMENVSLVSFTTMPATGWKVVQPFWKKKTVY
ncbi:MAG: UDP-2,3-diacylglucosamine diphosphatase [Thermodesulfobacteriota bacterium]|nr:UDP-2,3-diacylglucosamine diphosphatase [Thermodesulfobacteriota bacterium]